METSVQFNEFLKRMKAKFFNNDDFGYNNWSKDCVKYLYNSKVDYEKLYEYVIKYNPNGNFIPSTAWLYEQQKGCYKKEAKSDIKGQWRHVKIYNPIYKVVMNSDCFPCGTSDELIIKIYENRFNIKGWKILNSYE